MRVQDTMTGRAAPRTSVPQPMKPLLVGAVARAIGVGVQTLHFYEREGLIPPPARSASGYRIFGPGELQRLRTLRELLSGFGCSLSDMAFAKRLEREPALEEAVEKWIRAEPRRPEGVPSAGWLAWEQQKHQRLLAA